MTSSAEWSLSDVAAKQINKIRKRLGVNREELAKRCAALGHTGLTPAALANIETGRRNDSGKRRRDVTIEEVVALAQALGVPPIWLIFPVGDIDLVEVLPGRRIGSWTAVKWFSGESLLPNTPDSGAGDYSREFVMLRLMRRHDELVRQWVSHKREEADWARFPKRSGMSIEAAVAKFELGDARICSAIRATRDEMRGHGMEPPKLPLGLTLIENEMSTTEIIDGQMVTTVRPKQSE